MPDQRVWFSLTVAHLKNVVWVTSHQSERQHNLSTDKWVPQLLNIIYIYIYISNMQKLNETPTSEFLLRRGSDWHLTNPGCLILLCECEIGLGVFAGEVVRDGFCDEAAEYKPVTKLFTLFVSYNGNAKNVDKGSQSSIIYNTEAWLTMTLQKTRLLMS